MTQQDCPAQERLQAMVADQLPEEQLLELARHLRSCSACQTRFDKLAERVGLLAQIPLARRRAAEAIEPELERAMRSLHTDPRPSTVGAAATIDSPERHHPASEAVDLSFLAPSSEPASLGRLGVYEILEVIGKGGMGLVLRGRDTKLNRAVAIKVLAPWLASDGTARKRFRREAQAAAAVSHDHVVAIHGIDEINTTPFIVMAYIEGASLEERLRREGPLEVRRTLRIGEQAARGLAAAHAQGLVHRDIKPGNILLENGVERVKVSDFGLARAANDVRFTRTDTVAGTPEYMSPEQASGQALDHRSDLFSLGCVLYAMCTGRSPFRASTMIDAIRRVCDDEPRPVREVNADIPEYLARIIDKLLCKDPEQRFQSAAEVAELLGGHLRHLQAPDESPMPQLVKVGERTKTPARPTRQPHWALFVAGGLLLAAFLPICVWILTRAPDRDSASLETPRSIKPQGPREQAASLAIRADRETDMAVKIELFEQAVDLLERHGDYGKASAHLYGLSQAHRENEDLQASLAAHRRAIDQYDASPYELGEGVHGPAWHAALLADSLLELGDEVAALNYFRKAVRYAKLETPRMHVFMTFMLADLLSDFGGTNESRATFLWLMERYRQAMTSPTMEFYGEHEDELGFALSAGRVADIRSDDFQVAIRTLEAEAEQPGEHQAGALSELAIARSRLGEMKEANELMARASALNWKQDLHLGGEAVRSALSCDRRRFQMLRDADNASLESALREGIRRRDDRLPANHPQQAYIRQELASLHSKANKLKEAQSLLIEAYDILKSQPATPNRRWNALLEQLAANCEALNSKDAAARYQAEQRTPTEEERKAAINSAWRLIEGSRKKESSARIADHHDAISLVAAVDDKPAVAFVLGETAKTYAHDWRHAEAIDYCERAIEVFQSDEQAKYYDDLGWTFYMLSKIYSGLGDEERAFKWIVQMRRVHQQIRGDTNPATLFADFRMAVYYDENRRPEDAQPLWHKLRAEFEGAVEGDRSSIWGNVTADRAGLAFSAWPRVGVDKETQREALLASRAKISQAIAKPNGFDARAGWFFIYNAIISERLGEFDEAARAAAKASVVYWDLERDLTNVMMACYADQLRIRVLQQAGDEALLAKALQRIIEVRDSKLPEDHPQLAYPRQVLARVVAKQDRQAAMKLLLEAHDILQHQPMTPAPRWNALMEQLAKNAAALGEEDKAAAYRAAKR